MYDFLPSAECATDLDASRFQDIADSLAHISNASAEAIPELAGLVQPVIARIRKGERLSCMAFGEYFELTDALIDDDNTTALQAAQRLSAVPSRANELSIFFRGAPETKLLDACIDRRLGDEAAQFAPLAPDAAAEFPDRLREGLRLLEAGYPELATEIRTIVHEVVLSQAPKGASMEFDGASHYQFWGLLFLNPNHHKTRLAVAEVMAHEAGHSLLFGLMRTEPLVRNPDTERFTSPLRMDPRPMDGIFHATFVSARMALAMETLAQSGVLSDAERTEALTAADKDRKNFQSGISVIHEHGDLTDTGAKIMLNAENWIAQKPS